MSQSPWFKLVARNHSPLHISALYSQKHEGVEVGALSWRSNVDLVVKCEKPLAYLFGNSELIPTTTNFPDLLKTINPELDAALDQIIAHIEADLQLEPTNDESKLADLYQKFRTDSGFMVLGYSLAYFIEQKLKEVFGENRWKEIAPHALHPFKKTLWASELEEISRQHALFAEGKLDEQELKKVAASLAQKYGFVHGEYVGREWSEEDYVQEIKTSTQEAQKKEGQEFFTNTNLDPYEKWLVLVAQKSSFIFDEGKTALVRANWALRRSLAALGHDEKLILNLTEAEFLLWLKDKKLPDMQLLKERDLYFAIYREGDLYEEYTGKNEVEALIKKFGITEFALISELPAEIKGQIAFKGKVTGKVRIVFTQKDAEQLQDGEILVASMTTPELIGAMRKSAAFVTDEGGVTCHAAIIAREMRKPCVVGTEIATRVLKSGDLVEVDANTGIVTILN